jgi:polysaccharide biosynthesis protein PslH
MLPARAVSAIELVKMPRFERRMADGYDACLVTTVDDADALRATGNRAHIDVVPNGMPEPRPEGRVLRRQNELVFVGTMSYPPNVDGAAWFAREVLPAVRSHHHGVRLILVGRDPSATVRRLGRTPDVVVTGSVPDIRPFLARGTVFVAPLRIGGGYPNKVAEALGAGIPIVATPAAHRGIPGLVPGVHLLEGRTAPELAADVIRLLDDPGLGRRVGEAARQFAGSSAGWNVAVDRLEEIYRRAEGLVHSRGGPIHASA